MGLGRVAITLGARARRCTVLARQAEALRAR